MGVLCPRKRLGFVPSPLIVQLMLTHDQQQPTATDGSQNSYEQYIQNYAAQQVEIQVEDICITFSGVCATSLCSVCGEFLTE